MSPLRTIVDHSFHPQARRPGESPEILKRMAVPAKLRRFVTERACNRCEYCGLSAEGQAATFHMDHIVPQVVGGHTAPENLALACIHCSLRKGARRTASDPLAGQMAPLFHPRLDSWAKHFHWSGVELIGRTAIGRATVAALDRLRASVAPASASRCLKSEKPAGRKRADCGAYRAAYLSAAAIVRIGRKSFRGLSKQGMKPNFW
jgi:5-methylcytosine-specific restriction endonuclease McrA